MWPHKRDAIDDEILLAARRAASRTNARFVIGWWRDGAEQRLMLLPEGHHVTREPAFHPAVVVSPCGSAESLAA